MSRTVRRSKRVRPDQVRERAGELLARYQPLIGDWDAFLAALERPKPTCLVANRQRVDRDALRDLLMQECDALQPVAWAPEALRVPPGRRPGLWWGFLAGLYQVQEEASLLPVALLDPQPGERVLDLCAAPGGKTAQIAMAVGHGGTVVANDKDGKRLTAVRDKMKRFGLANLTTTVHDGGDYPLAAGPFDRVLVDAPCTSEGTKFRSGASYLKSESNFRAWITGQQAALLRRAAQLVRPGGRIVYSTCSFAPEENEAIVDAVLAELGEELVPVDACPAGLSPAAAVEAWQGQSFRAGVGKGIRLWPHTHGTGGFFAIALERRGDRPAQAAGAPADLGAVEAPAALLQRLFQDYDLPAAALRGFDVLRKGEHWQVVSDLHRPPARPQPVSTGVPVRRCAAHGEKPTTSAALLFGDAARRNVVELDAAQRDAYHRRETVHPRPEQLAACAPRGYVIVRYLGKALGCGFLRPGPPPQIDSQFPRAWVVG